MGEPCEEVALEATDQEFHVFPILKVIRMIRNSMNTPITPMFGSWSDSSLHAGSTKIGDQSEIFSKRNSLEGNKSGDLMKKNGTANNRLSSPRSDLKTDGSVTKNSLTSIALNSDYDRSVSFKVESPIQKKSDSDSQEDTNPKSLSHSGVSTDVPNLLVPGFHIQTPQPLFRGSLHLKHASFQFHIDETDSEDSLSSEERPKSAKDSKESAQGSQGVEEHHVKSIASSRSQYQSKLSINSADSWSQSKPSHK
jgi:hypothetical protein